MTARYDSFYNDVRGTVLTGLASVTAAAIAATDTVLQALQKLQATVLTLAPIASPSFTGNVNMAAKLAVNGFVIQGAATTVAAAGTVMGGATALTKQVNIVTSATAALAVGVSLPDQSPASGYVAVTTIKNTTSTAISVYPPTTTAKINALSAGAAFSLAAGAASDFIQVSSTQWWTA